MPVGFENSALKMSFSLSSLQPSSASLESPEHASLRSERPYNSLTKKPRKDPEQETWRRSWGSRDDKEEFWAALQPNYAYLMDSQLIESCRAGPGWAEGSAGWSYDEFTCQFADLYAWLNRVQEGVYGKEENVTDRELRLSHVEEMQRNAYKRKVFNERSASLLERSPQLSEEVTWRVSHLNSKWEMLEQTLMTPTKVNSDQEDVCTDVEHEVRCLRKWLNEMETRLQPLDFRTRWTPQELEEKAREHVVLQRDVESHGKIVCSVVKLCERLGRGHAEGEEARARRRRDARDAARVAQRLESRWHHLYLRSLEWTYYIETLAQDRLASNSPGSVGASESDEEPVTKHPRLCQDAGPSPTPAEEDGAGDALLMDTSPPLDADADADADQGAMVGTKKRRSVVSREEIQAASLPAAAHIGQLVIGSPKAATAEQCVLATARWSTGSIFNRSNREAPNYATFYFKHLDTDSEQDAGKEAEVDVNEVAEAEVSLGEKSPEESSEEEWTFTSGHQNGGLATETESSSETATPQEPARKGCVVVRLDFGQPGDGLEDKLVVEDTVDAVGMDVETPCPRRNSRESIQRLVIRAEEMVSSPAARVFEPLVFAAEGAASTSASASSQAKQSRVREWLRAGARPPADSCDASGEYTTGDSDDDRESQSSEEYNGSVATCRQVESADDATPLAEKGSPSHVVLRSRRRLSERPWSVSGVPQGLVDAAAAAAAGASCDPLAHFSISETALNHMGTGSPQRHASSSTIDGTTPTVAGDPGSGTRTESLRRRKLRTRKRTTGRKSESGSEGAAAGGGSDKVLSGGGGGDGGGSPAMQRGDRSSDSGEEEAARIRLPAFRLGPEGGPVSFPKGSSLGAGAATGAGAGAGAAGPEEHSSLSEQAWDSYQEKYLSEPYSEEPADAEAARRLLEFGDDYRNFIDSQSDGASSLSANPVPSPARRRRTLGAAAAAGADAALLDSDSDLEDIKHLMQQSRSQLVFTENVFTRQLAKASPELVLATDFAEIAATCRENILCLRTILENVDEEDGGLLSAHECREIRGLVERWEVMQGRTEDLQRVRALQREMASLKDELQDLASRVAGMESNMENRDQLENHINQVKTELSSLRDRKTKLLDVNVAVHRFLTDTGHPAAVLKDDVADLYRVWDETFQSVSQRLGALQKVSAAWQQFESHLADLQVALRADQATLRMLDSALLQGGPVTSDVASSVRDVAKVLSEKQERYEALCQKPPTVLSDSTTATATSEVMTCALSTEGSLSDSGISDEGSEQELSERERRLEALRRLARHLEGVLAPGSRALVNMAKRIEQTEADLRGLQRTCRDLIVRTAVCVEARAAPAPAAPLVKDPPARPKPQPRSRRCSGERDRKGRKPGVAAAAAAAAPGDWDPDKRRSWLWRVMRAALPFQLALVALFCVACLLEPHCCDAINNLNLSLTPQLRYLRGPPPI